MSVGRGYSEADYDIQVYYHPHGDGEERWAFLVTQEQPARRGRPVERIAWGTAESECGAIMHARLAVERRKDALRLARANSGRVTRVKVDGRL